MKYGYAGSLGLFVRSSLEVFISSLLVASSSSMVPAGDGLVGRGAYFFTKTGLEVKLLEGRVEARLCGSGMEVVGGNEMVVGEAADLTGEFVVGGATCGTRGDS